MERSFYQTPEAQRPFEPEAIAECFADVKAAALKVLPKGVLRHWLIERGYLDGDWLSRLYQRHALQVTIDVRDNLQAYHYPIGITRLPKTVWEAVPPPDNHREPAPERAVSYFDLILRHAEVWTNRRSDIFTALSRLEGDP